MQPAPYRSPTVVFAVLCSGARRGVRQGARRLTLFAGALLIGCAAVYAQDEGDSEFVTGDWVAAHQSHAPFDSSMITVRRPSRDVFAREREDGTEERRNDRGRRGGYGRSGSEGEETPTASAPEVQTPSWGGWSFVAYTLAALAVIYIILQLTKSNVRGLFRKRGQTAVVDQPQLEEENIHEMDFDALVEDAIQRGDFRRAVRLLYLEQIRLLSDRRMIVWRIDKTNHDYVRELRSEAVKASFVDITRHFEYIWYGDLAIDAGNFGHVREHFRSFASAMGSAA